MNTNGLKAAAKGSRCIFNDKLRPIFIYELLDSHQRLADDCPADVIGSCQKPFLLVDCYSLEVLQFRDVAF
jgi:hypothetical protein